MFENLDPQSTPNKPQNQDSSATGKRTAPPQPPQVEDIFSRTDPTASKSPISSQGNLAGNMDKEPMMTDGDIFSGKSLGQSKIFKIGIAIVVVLVVLAVIWLAVSWLSSDNGEMGDLDSGLNQNVSNANTAIQNQNNNVANTNQPTNNNANNVNVSANQNTNLAVPAKDTDNDGLSDDEEEVIGSDPKNFDTDGDGLIDRAEVKVYKTDPTNPDTDGDGYSDGQEVVNGYDPNVPGNARLYDVP